MGILARAIFWQCVLMCFTHPLLGGGEVWRDSSWSGKRRNSFCSCDLGISVLTFAVQTAETACLNPTQLFSYLRGRSQTTLTRFWPFLTTYLPIFDIGEGIPLLLKKKKSAYRWHSHYPKSLYNYFATTTYLSTSSCQRSLWTPP